MNDLYEHIRKRLREPEVLLPIFIVSAIITLWLTFVFDLIDQAYVAVHVLLYLSAEIIAVKFVRRDKPVTAAFIPALLTLAVYLCNVLTSVMYATPDIAGVEHIKSILRNLGGYLLSMQFTAPLITSYVLLIAVFVFRQITKRKKQKLPISC
jgi:hypothetical protein